MHSFSALRSQDGDLISFRLSECRKHIFSTEQPTPNTLAQGRIQNPLLISSTRTPPSLASPLFCGPHFSSICPPWATLTLGDASQISPSPASSSPGDKCPQSHLQLPRPERPSRQGPPHRTPFRKTVVQGRVQRQGVRCGNCTPHTRIRRRPRACAGRRDGRYHEHELPGESQILSAKNTRPTSGHTRNSLRS